MFNKTTRMQMINPTKLISAKKPSAYIKQWMEGIGHQRNTND